jgi:flagella basal body P-ring formation protein FlgA
VRVFHSGELRRLAAAHQLTADVNKNVCFAWELAVPAQEDVKTAIRKALTDLNPQIEILEQSQAAAPHGDVCFPLSGLSAISDKPVVWKGYVAYAGNRRFSTWALVRIRIRISRVVAMENLPAGEQVTAAQLRLETYEGPPTRESLLTQVSQAVGLIVRCNIPAGAAVFSRMLAVPQDVKRGDLVMVVAENGAARIETQGIAEQPGRRGDIISIRNPKSGKAFRARVQSQGSVLVVPGGSVGLVGEEQKS